ncbi:MAG: hypothetical protein IJ036_04855 [Lachnospiraceae bacterium]|nr:hypothetical protein [Lachnospiraceae bacterium]
MWILAILYLLNLIPKIISFFKNDLHGAKETNIWYNILDIITDIATLSILVFAALERIGIEINIALIVMVVCYIVKKKVKK